MPQYLLYVFTLVSTSLAAISVCFFVSCIVHDDSTANTVLIVVYAIMLIFGGLLANVRSVCVL